MTKTASPKREAKVLRTLHDLLRYWKEQHKSLLVEIGIGVVTQACYGVLDEVAPGNFLVHLKGSRSLLVLDGEWQRHAKHVHEDGKQGIMVSRKGTNSTWIRLSDAGVEPTEVDIQTVLRQLTLWAQARTLIFYRSGTDISDVIFVARLVGPGDSDSFLVVGDPEGGLPRISRMAGQILLRSAESVRIHREENHVTVVLRSGGGNICLVSDASGSPEDQLMQLRSLSKLQN
jgi:hypothetical protein